MSIAPAATSPSRSIASAWGALACLLTVAVVALTIPRPVALASVGHLLVSEVVTGGASASDEMIEVYNPSPSALPLEGLELVYVTASGATISRRAAWSLGAATVPPGGHVLVANELGIYASIADAVYASGMAATGGSVAIRIQGASTAIDAVGWGTAASVWIEARPAPAAPAGSSLERLPGGPAGSTTDTDDNLADFAIQPMPDPQNAASPPVPTDPPSPSPEPTPNASPTPTATAPPTPEPSADPTPTPVESTTPSPAPSLTPSATPSANVTIAQARALPDGSSVSIAALALTGFDFAEGGGYLADETGGIAILLDAGSFARGDLVAVSGTVDDRFAQRTLRAASALVTPDGPAAPAPIGRASGAIDESVEGRLVRVSGTVDGGPTTLTGGLAFDVDDGSGPIRVVVGSATGIDTAAWTDGRPLSIVGVVGQRDSSGSGTAGYRVQPRDPADVEVLPDPSPDPSPTASPDPDPTPTPGVSGPPSGVTGIADARAAPKNTRLTVRGVVTLASGTIDAGSAVIQDGSGAILLRLSEEAGSVDLDELIVVDGVRSTKGGMETLRVAEPPTLVGIGASPEPRSVRTGEAGEADEAQLIVVRGALVATPRRASSGTVSFDVDDGSGPLHVTVGSELGLDDEALERGSWVEVVGVLGQETSGSKPLRGYRLWPRGAADLRVLAVATDAEDLDGVDDARAADGRRGPSSGGGLGSASLDEVGRLPVEGLRVGATLVTSGWDEVGLAGVLWDGRTVVGLTAESREALERAIGASSVPVALELEGLAAAGSHPSLGIELVSINPAAIGTVVGSSPPSRPLTRLPAAGALPAWVSVVGRLAGDTLTVPDGQAAVEVACQQDQLPHSARVSVTGLGLSDPARLVVPCDGIRPASALELIPAGARVAASPGAPIGPVLGVDQPPDGRRSLAAGMLAVASVALVLVGVAVRRLRHPPHDDITVEPEDGADGPRLTLVAMPREHGP